MNTKTISSSKIPAVKNGECRSTTGYRVIITSATYELRPITHLIHSGYEPDRGTFQAPTEVGDLSWSCVWDRQYPKGLFSICKWDGSGWVAIPTGNTKMVWSAMEEKNPWTLEFLSPQHRSPSYIPREIYGESLAERDKRQRLEAFAERYNLSLDEYMKELWVTPKNLINLIPVVSEVNWNQYIPQWNSHTGSIVGINKKELFFAWNGEELTAINCQYEGKHGSNYAYSKTEYSEGAPLVIPDGTKVLIKITKGVLTRDHYNYGCGIDVYKL